ncbi:TPA: trypsin-like serine peptidase [Staphylococcus pseudintermedius]
MNNLLGKIIIATTLTTVLLPATGFVETHLYAKEYSEEEIQKKQDSFKIRPDDSNLFEKIKDTTKKPYHSVGTVFVKGETLASGILIGKDTVITNNHVARLAKKDPTKVIFTPGSTREEGSLIVNEPFGRFIAEDINESPYGGGVDLSIIKLKPNENGQSAGDIITPARIPDHVDVQSGDVISLLGYPYNTTTHALFRSQIEVFSIVPFQYFGYTEQGNSGSGIFNLQGELVGIHSGKGGQYNLPLGLLFSRQVGSLYSIDHTSTTMAKDLKNRANSDSEMSVTE